MSIGSLGAIGSFAAAPATQRSSDVDKTQHEAAEKARGDDAADYAEQAAGIGETQEESQAGDRDADGRRLWEIGERKKEEAAADDTIIQGPSKDPTGTAGNQLDLTG
jgi:hypothetical protein